MNILTSISSILTKSFDAPIVLGTSIVLTNLDLYYNPASTEGVTGTTLNDMSGKGNNGTLQGGASVSSGIIQINSGYVGTAYPAQYISTTYLPNLDDKPYTFELWFLDNSPGVTSSSSAGLISNYINTTIKSTASLHITNAGFCEIYERNAPGTTSSGYVDSTNICNGYWNHIVKTSDALNQKLYINGTLIYSIARVSGAITSAQSIRIGGGVNSRYMSCRLGAIRVYVNYALTSTDVLTNYTVERSIYS